MKLVRGFTFAMLAVSLALGTFTQINTSQAGAQGMPTFRPCQQPAGFPTPVALDSSTDSTEPRLITERDAQVMGLNHPTNGTGLSVEWSFSGWGNGQSFGGEVLFSGLWALPRTGALTLDGGWAALVTVESGSIVLLACGQDGEIDTVYNDGQSTALAAGSSTPIVAGTSFYIFLQEKPANYWLFGNRTGDSNESAVTIQIIGPNGGPHVCGISTCWPAPVLPGPPTGSNCDENTCDSPGQPGGCGGIRCWTK